MKPIDHTQFAIAARIPTRAPQHLTRTWIKVNGKLECRYETAPARK